MASADDLKTFIRKRAVVKASITYFKKFLEEYANSEPDRLKLRLRLDAFKQSYSSFDQIQESIDRLDEENLEVQINERFQVTNDYLNLVAAAENLLIIAYAPDPVVPFINDHIIQGSNENTCSRVISKRRVKLPETSLPTFSGRYEDWLSFKDAFRSLIDDQDDLTNVEKLQYLKAAVKNEAANKIKKLNVTDDNYKRAWDLLERAYEDKRLLVASHLNSLLCLPVQEHESTEGLTKIADDAQQHIESLATLGVSVGEEMLVQIVEGKLPRITVDKWEETLKKGIFPKLEDLFEFLYKAAARLARREDIRSDGTQSIKSNSKGSRYSSKFKAKDNRSSKQVFVVNAGKAKFCPLCPDQGHFLFRCEKFRELPVSRRVEIVRDASLCSNCLRSHEGKACKFSKCQICNQQHNVLLHNASEGNL